LVLKVKKPSNPDGTFTVRGDVAGVVVEKIYPLSFPKFDKVILLDEYKTRQAKLYYLRDKIGKDARMKSKITASKRNKDILKK
jgi:large subunit ribosomal protein L19